MSCNLRYFYKHPGCYLNISYLNHHHLLVFSDYVMRLFCQISSLQLLIFCTDDQEFVANFIFIYVFFCIIIIVNHFLFFLHCYVSYVTFLFLHCYVSFFLCIIYFFVSYAYVSIESIDCILLWLLAINAILLTSSINTLCFSLLNLCCHFDISLLFL